MACYMLPNLNSVPLGVPPIIRSNVEGLTCLTPKDHICAVIDQPLALIGYPKGYEQIQTVPP